MEKRIFVCCIIAVVILVLVSFTGVVGYQTTSTSIAKASPLFIVRSKRAIDEETEDLTCNYVGKGKDTTIPFSRTHRIETSSRKIINAIRNIDEERFYILVKLVSKYLSGYRKDSDIDFVDLEEALELIRSKTNGKQLLIPDNKPIPTVFFCTYGNQWEPGCIINWIANAVFLYAFAFIVYILKILTGGEFTNRCWETMLCDTIDCTYYCRV